MIKLIIVLISGLLMWLGGRSWGHKAFRRIGIPLILALYFAIKCKWWLFFPVGATLGILICLGYGEPDK